MVTFNFGQWVVELDEEAGAYRIFNPDEDGNPRFYQVVSGAQYKQPLIEPEPHLAFPVPEGLEYVNVDGEPVVPNQKISGIICQDGPRFSLSNARKQGIEIKANYDGSLTIGDETWWIVTLFMKDKNRILNYDAFCVKVKPEQVKVLELGDLDLF